MYLVCLFFICSVEKVYIICQSHMAIYTSLIIQNHTFESLYFHVHSRLHGYWYNLKWCNETNWKVIYWKCHKQCSRTLRSEEILNKDMIKYSEFPWLKLGKNEPVLLLCISLELSDFFPWIDTYQISNHLKALSNQQFFSKARFLSWAHQYPRSL